MTPHQHGGSPWYILQLRCTAQRISGRKDSAPIAVRGSMASAVHETHVYNTTGTCAITSLTSTASDRHCRWLRREQFLCYRFSHLRARASGEGPQWLPSPRSRFVCMHCAGSVVNGRERGPPVSGRRRYHLMVTRPSHRCVTAGFPLLACPVFICATCSNIWKSCTAWKSARAAAGWCRETPPCSGRLRKMRHAATSHTAQAGRLRDSVQGDVCR
jgi:hypothetical protein